MKADLKYYLEDLYWFIRNELVTIYYKFKKLIKGLINVINELLTLQNYFYIVLAMFLIIIIKDPRVIHLTVLVFAILYLLYKKYKTGTHKAYMRRKKGYGLH